jgi:hypothetical protein
MVQLKTRASGEVGLTELYDLFKEPKLSITIRIARLRRQDVSEEWMKKHRLVE